MLPATYDYNTFYNAAYGTYNASLFSNYNNTPMGSIAPYPGAFAELPSVLNETSSSSSSNNSIKDLSPEQQIKHREKRNRNNEAAKQSRIKRTARENKTRDELRECHLIILQKDTEIKKRYQSECQLMQQIQFLTQENERKDAEIARLKQILALQDTKESAQPLTEKQNNMSFAF